VSPENPYVISNGIRVKYLGDLATTTPPPDLSSKILLIPTSPSSHAKVKEGYTSWMLVTPDMITKDGSECDKIGVSYKRFNLQVNRCRVEAGTCLDN